MKARLCVFVTHQLTVMLHPAWGTLREQRNKESFGAVGGCALMNRVTVLLTAAGKTNSARWLVHQKHCYFTVNRRPGVKREQTRKKQNQKKNKKKIHPPWTRIKSRFTSDVGNLVNDFEKSSRWCRFPQSSHRKDVRAATAVSFGGEPL